MVGGAFFEAAKSYAGKREEGGNPAVAVRSFLAKVWDGVVEGRKVQEGGSAASE